MKNYIPIIFICVFLSFNKKVKCQELPIYSQYMFNEYLINSAYAGTYYFTPVMINHRQQWAGFGDSAPNTSSISLHGGVGEKSSIGTSMLYDQTSPISRTKLEMSYAYHTRLSKTNDLKLSMALGGTWNIIQFMYQENMTYSEMTNGIIDNVNQGNETTNYADINLGLLLFNDYFDFGVNFQNLLAPEPNNNNDQDSINRMKYILIHGSYLGRNNPRGALAIIPSFVMRKMGLFTYNDLLQFDLNIRLVYRNKIWTGISYRTHEKAICTLVGFNTEKAFFGFSYDIGASKLGAYHNGSSNIAIGLKIGRKKKRQIRNQTPFYLNLDNDWKKFRINNMRHKTGK